jgi:fructose-bisphosphate aldolase class II
MTNNVRQARELMDRSREEHFAVGAFNADNQETLLAIVRAAAAMRAVVDYAAQTTGAVVENEPHYFAGSSTVHREGIDYDELRTTFSTPEGARAFVAASGINTIAAAMGNLHGRYPVPIQLDLELLRRIRDAIDANISLHGGTGPPGRYFEQAARIGVSKINVNTDIRYAYRTGLERPLREHPDEYAVVKLIGTVIRSVQGVVEDRIDVFGSAGKARP